MRAIHLLSVLCVLGGSAFSIGPAFAQVDSSSQTLLDAHCSHPDEHCLSYGFGVSNPGTDVILSWNVNASLSDPSSFITFRVRDDLGPSSTFSGASVSVPYDSSNSFVNVGNATSPPTVSHVTNPPKPGWALTEKIAEAAGTVISLLTLAAAAIELGVAAPIILASFLALALIAIPEHLLSSQQPLVAIVRDIRNVVIDVVKAIKIFGESPVNAGVGLSLLGIVAATTAYIAHREAADPPDPNYTNIPVLAANPFDPLTPDGAFGDALAAALDAGAINIQALERYQGAVLANSDSYAADQLAAYHTSALALSQAGSTLRDDTYSLVGAMNPNSPTPTPSEIAAAELLFLNTALPSDLVNDLQVIGLSESSFKQGAIDQYNESVTAPSRLDAELYGAGVFGNLSAVAALNSTGTPLVPGGGGTAPEPGSIALVALGALAMGAMQRRKRCGAPCEGVR